MAALHVQHKIQCAPCACLAYLLLIVIDNSVSRCCHCTSMTTVHILSTMRRLARRIGPFITFVVAKCVLKKSELHCHMGGEKQIVISSH